MPTEVSREILLNKLRFLRINAEKLYFTRETDTMWLSPFLALMWLTGGRVSEILMLRGRDLKEYELEGKRVIIVSLVNLKQRGLKNRVKESLIIPDQYPEIWAFIEEWWKKHPEGRMFNRSRKTVWYHCNKNFQLGSHRVGRHSWVMEKARRGTALLDVRQLGGWKLLASMDTYVHVFGRKELAKRLIKTEDFD